METNTIKLSDELETRIRDALAPLHPEMVVLFGSSAWGQPTADSDIDLYVVTQDDFLPAT
jgi:predicted nucleotidyltransferase